ncbi:hypothetical protein AVEN_171009-1 [Araneus ventricosus]|uniref:Uncharacterized protein n=1 Tax=Araneus ventricosus TaxID=182803 RepID=A0A4Y2UI51_ARAVE|nr:hypothetical protein AVEN_171009-1 [Araneus ventricosus]
MRAILKWTSHFEHSQMTGRHLNQHSKLPHISAGDMGLLNRERPARSPSVRKNRGCFQVCAWSQHSFSKLRTISAGEHGFSNESVHSTLAVQIAEERGDHASLA